MLELEDDVWDIFRSLRGRNSKGPYPSLRDHLDELLQWVTKPSSAVRVLPGDGRHEALACLQRAFPDTLLMQETPWRGNDVIGTVLRALRALRSPGSKTSTLMWGFLLELMRREHLVLDEQIQRGVLTRDPSVRDAVRLLTDLRRSQRMRDWSMVLNACREVDTWLNVETRSKAERIEVALILTVVARQNHILDPWFIVFDNLENATSEDLEDLYALTSALQKWHPYGCPIHLLIGWDARRRSELRKLHPGLARTLRESLRWCTPDADLRPGK